MEADEDVPDMTGVLEGDQQSSRGPAQGPVAPSARTELHEPARSRIHEGTDRAVTSRASKPHSGQGRSRTQVQSLVFRDYWHRPQAQRRAAAPTGAMAAPCDECSLTAMAKFRDEGCTQVGSDDSSGWNREPM